MQATPSTRVAPEIIVGAGCLIALITFGPRASVGLFQLPMTTEYGWGRDTFSLAIALQNLLWGVGQPFAGAIADRFGAVRVVCVGALLYIAGLVVMAYATSPALMHLGGRRADRLRAVRLLLQRGARRLRQAPARALAADGLRGRHGRRLLRAVPFPRSATS